MPQVIGITALNRYVKSVLEGDAVLADLALRGEIANFVRHAKSGHCYFSLRDAQSSVKAVMFSRDAARLAFRPQDGMQVVVRCRVSLYERDGAFQVYVRDLMPDGIGAAQMAFEELKARLAAEGLFRPEAKQPLPPMPSCVGVVTSGTGAALQDILQVIGRRWPLTRLLVAPVNVQGREAAAQIAGGIRALDADGRAQVIIVARGGGSREDLWVFNDEGIARAAFACRTPLISAVGHEIDYTILDFVADMRAPTPSAAAELAVPDQAQIRRVLAEIYDKMHKNMQDRLHLCYNDTVTARQNLADLSPLHGIEQRRARLDNSCRQLGSRMETCCRAAQTRFAHSLQVLDSLSPYRVLARGYCIPETRTGKSLCLAQQQPGQQLWLRGDGCRARCRIESIEVKQNEDTEKL